MYKIMFVFLMGIALFISCTKTPQKSKKSIKIYDLNYPYKENRNDNY